MANFTAESPKNYEQKCLCVLVLDVSGSMSGQPIDELNRGLIDFYNDIKTDQTTSNRLEVAIIEFNDTITCRLEPSLIADFSMPTLAASGTTKLVDAVRVAMAKVQDRKNWYKSTSQAYYRPWIILMTDGAPDNGQDVSGLAGEIHAAIAKKEFIFFAVGVQGADMNMLKQISDSNMPPAQLQGLKFSAFFQWLSRSMTTISHSKDGQSSWMQGFAIN